MSIYEYFSVHECITKGFIVTGGMNVYLLSNKKKTTKYCPLASKKTPKQALKQLAIDSLNGYNTIYTYKDNIH